MSVVAWDGTIMAADSQGHNDNGRYTMSKIRRVNDTLVGWVGTTVYGLLVLNWLENGAKIEDWPTNIPDDNTPAVLVVNKTGIFVYDGRAIPIEIKDQFAAIGSGAPFAMGAMSAGKDAVEAVQIAIKWDHRCGAPVESLRLE